ncbi:unnamed protein product [Rhodiola kirilowii]
MPPFEQQSRYEAGKKEEFSLTKKGHWKTMQKFLPKKSVHSKIFSSKSKGQDGI